MNQRNIRLMTAVLAILTVVILLVAAAQVSAGTSIQSSQQITNTTAYDGTTAAQKISVTLTISPVETSMSEIRVEIASARRTLLLADSFTTTITPSNRRVNVTPMGDGVFIIEELEPGETVDIEFTVVPTTLAPESIVAAEMTVEYAQDGRSPTRALTPTADISSNPWHHVGESHDGTPMLYTVIGVFGVGIVGLVAGAGWMRSRRDSGVEWSAIEPAIDRAKRRVNDTVAAAEIEQLEATLRDRFEADETDEGDTSWTDLSVLSAFSDSSDLEPEETDSDDEFPKL
jgi:hypothetical protein